MNTQKPDSLILFILFHPIVLGVFLFSIIFSSPSKIKEMSYVNISNALIIHANEIQPPRMALNAIDLNTNPEDQSTNWSELSLPGTSLVANQEHTFLVPSVSPSETMELEKSIQAETETNVQTDFGTRTFASSEKEVQQNDDYRDWYRTLSPAQQNRLMLSGLSPTTVETESKETQKQTEPVLDSSTVIVPNKSSQKSVVSSAEIKNQKAQPSKYKINGHITLANGAGLGDGHVEVRKIEDGVVNKVVTVDPVKANFTIEFNNPTGHLLAAVVNKDGKIIAKGTQKVSKALFDPLNVGQKLEITVTPVQAAVSGGVSSFSDQGFDGEVKRSKKSFQSADIVVPTFQTELKSEPNGEFTLSEITQDSTYIVQASAQKHFAATQINFTENSPDVVLYEQKTIHSLLEWITTQPELQINDIYGGIIYGKVSQDGLALMGAEVSVESDEGARIVYLNDFFLPDARQKVTSSNGMFIVLNVQEGLQSLVAHRNFQYLGHENILVQEETVSTAQIKSTQNFAPVELKVFDAFSGTAESAQLVVQSLPEMVETNGLSILNMPQIQRLSLIQYPGSDEYLRSYYTYFDTTDYIHIPLIPALWLQDIKSNRKIDDDPNTGTVIGFVSDQNFQAHLSAIENFSKNNIVYFDSAGNVMNGDSGVLGGGFIIFNVPVGVQSILVLPENGEKISSRVSVVDPNTTSVFNYSFVE